MKMDHEEYRNSPKRPREKYDRTDYDTTNQAR